MGELMRASGLGYRLGAQVSCVAGMRGMEGPGAFVPLR